MGKKKNQNARLRTPKASGAVGAEDRAPKARGVSMQLGGLGDAVSSPAGPPNHIRCIFGLKMLYLFKRQLMIFILLCILGCIRCFSVSETIANYALLI